MAARNPTVAETHHASSPIRPDVFSTEELNYMRNKHLGGRVPQAFSALSLAAALALGVAAPQAMAVVIPKVAPTDLGVASPTQVRTLSSGLTPRNSDALDALVESVADPKSPNFRQFLTTAGFAAQ